MKISFVTELPFFGKTPIHDNMRTEFSWMFALDADNIPILQLDRIPDNSYDISIIIIPKELGKYSHIPIIHHLKRISQKIAFMQEGPSWYYQDLPLKLSFLYYSIMSSVDFVLAHNQCDKQYYEGLLEKPVFINPSLMIEESIGKIESVERKNVIVAGNFCRWYGGFDSYVVANTFGEEIYMPSMGRMKPEETNIDGIKHLPYLTWKNWIHTLNNFKYAVHLMPTIAAATFSLNCSYLNLPCIGNIKCDTQRLCFPNTSIDITNISLAKKIAYKLKNDKNFYEEVANKAKVLYTKHFSMNVYRETINKTLNSIWK